jgi:hypothetical protein
MFLEQKQKIKALIFKKSLNFVFIRDAKCRGTNQWIDTPACIKMRAFRDG